MEEAGKVVEPAQASATERLSLSAGGRLRDLQDPNSRRGRILASMGILRDPVADTRERSAEPFQPSEESITTLAEMGFGRDHALEALETVATNRVEVAMEYALTHPPSSPSTLERRRAAREQRRLEHQQRQNDSERQSSTSEERPSPDVPDDRAPNTDVTQNQPSDSNPPTTNEEESKPKSLTEDELEATKEKLAADEVKAYLDTVKDGLPGKCITLIATCSSVAEDNVKKVEAVQSDDLKGTGDSDSQGVIIVVSNFLLDICRAYPALESKIATEREILHLFLYLFIPSLVIRSFTHSLVPLLIPH